MTIKQKLVDPVKSHQSLPLSLPLYSIGEGPLLVGKWVGSPAIPHRAPPSIRFASRTGRCVRYACQPTTAANPILRLRSTIRELYRTGLYRTRKNDITEGLRLSIIHVVESQCQSQSHVYTYFSQ